MLYKKILKKDIFANFLYKILVIYIVFDGLRNHLVISSYITYFKEMTTLLLFIYIILIKKIIFIENKYINKVLLGYVIFIFIFFPFIWMSKPTFNYLTEPFIMYYKVLQFFILVYIFSVYELVTKYKYEDLLEFFIKLLIIFVLITPLIYFTNPSFMVPDFKQWGRISIGYPTMDAENLVFGIVLMFFVFQKTVLKSSMILLLLLLGILMQNTATGYITLGFVIVYYLFFGSKYKVNQKSIVFVGILSFIIVSLIIFKYGDLLKEQLYLFQLKINALLDPNGSKSLSIRAEEFNNEMRYINSSFDNFFGIGFRIYLENQFDWFRIGTGLLGLCGFIIFLLNMILYGFIIRKKDRSILLISSIIFALTSYSLITLYLFPTEASYAMMIGYSLHLQRRLKFAKTNNRL